MGTSRNAPDADIKPNSPSDTSSGRPSSRGRRRPAAPARPSASRSPASTSDWRSSRWPRPPLAPQSAVALAIGCRRVPLGTAAAAGGGEADGPILCWRRRHRPHRPHRHHGELLRAARPAWGRPLCRAPGPRWEGGWIHLGSGKPDHGPLFRGEMGDVSVGSLPAGVTRRVGWDAAGGGRGSPNARCLTVCYRLVLLLSTASLITPWSCSSSATTAPPSGRTSSKCLCVCPCVCARLSAGARRAGSRGRPDSVYRRPVYCPRVPGGSAGRQELAAAPAAVPPGRQRHPGCGSQSWQDQRESCSTSSRSHSSLTTSKTRLVPPCPVSRSRSGTGIDPSVPSAIWSMWRK